MKLNDIENVYVYSFSNTVENIANNLGFLNRFIWHFSFILYRFSVFMYRVWDGYKGH